MIIDSKEALERLQADGQISTGDADEVRTFMAFLAEAPTHAERGTSAGRRALREAYAKHYPEDFAVAVAEQKRRLASLAATSIGATQRMQLEGLRRMRP